MHKRMGPIKISNPHNLKTKQKGENQNIPTQNNSNQESKIRGEKRKKVNKRKEEKIINKRKT